MMSFLSELWLYMRRRKRYWLFLPLVVLVLVGTLIVLATGTPLAPFIYSLF